MKNNLAKKSKKELGPSEVLNLLKKYGHCDTSFQILKSCFQYHFNQKGCIGYVETKNAWVGAGDPISAPEVYATLALDFFKTAQSKGHRALLFAASDFTSSHPTLQKIPVGDTAQLNASVWMETFSEYKSLKKQLRRASTKGVKVEHMDSEKFCQSTDPLRYTCQKLFDQWVSTKKMNPMGFMASFEPFLFVKESCFFIATQNKKMVGFLVAIPIYGQKGWLIEHALRSPQAPNGTVELMIHTAMKTFSKKGQNHVSMGLTPFYGKVTLPLRFIRRMMGSLYNFKGLRTFKEKLPSVIFEPSYLIYPTGQSKLLTLNDFVQAITFKKASSFLWQAFIQFLSRLSAISIDR